MIKTDLIVGTTIDRLLNDLNGALWIIAKEHGENSIISVSHAHPTERLVKFTAMITYKTKD